MIADTACPPDWKLHLWVTPSWQVAGTLRQGACCVGEGRGEAVGAGPECAPQVITLALTDIKELQSRGFPTTTHLVPSRSGSRAQLNS